MTGEPQTGQVAIEVAAGPGLVGEHQRGSSPAADGSVCRRPPGACRSRRDTPADRRSAPGRGRPRSNPYGRRDRRKGVGPDMADLREHDAAVHAALRLWPAQANPRRYRGSAVFCCRSHTGADPLNSLTDLNAGHSTMANHMVRPWCRGTGRRVVSCVDRSLFRTASALPCRPAPG